MTGWMTDVLNVLNEAQVRYLVVGGVAVVLHGHLRATKDIDLVIQLEPTNLARAMSALAGAGYRPRAPVALEEFADPANRERWRREKGMLVFQVWHPSVPAASIDLFVEEPFDFDAEYAAALHVPTAAVTVPVVPLDTLLAMKRRVGRHQDIADCEALELLRDASRAREDESDE